MGFGPGAADLGKKYEVTLLPEEKVGTRAGLRPRPQAPHGRRPLLRRSGSGWTRRASIPVQTRLTEPTGDYSTIRFEDVVVNRPLPSTAFELKLPKDVAEVK